MRNLRAYMKALDELGHVKAIKEEVDWAVDAAALTATSYRQVGPALHFQKIQGYPDGYSMAGIGHLVQESVVPVIADAHHRQRDISFAGELGGLEAVLLITIGLAVGEQDQVAVHPLAMPAVDLVQAQL